MSAAKHTPGPWVVFEKHIGAGGTLPIVHRTKWWSHGINEIEDAANARLIAAAPDLLEELREIVEMIDPCGHDVNFDAARAAIAKATGATT